MTDDDRDRLYPGSEPLGSDRELPFHERSSWLRRHIAPLVTLLLIAVVLGGGLFIVGATWNSGTPTSSAGLYLPSSSAPTGTGTVGPPGTGATRTPPARVTLQGTLLTISGSEWSMKGTDGKTYIVRITARTRYAKKLTQADFAVGNPVEIIGRLTNTTLTAISVSKLG